MIGQIGIEHSVEFRSKFCIVALKAPKQINGVTTRVWSVVLRDDLTQSQARLLAPQIREAIELKFTNENCKYCSGIGGCYMYDS